MSQRSFYGLKDIIMKSIQILIGLMLTLSVASVQAAPIVTLSALGETSTSVAGTTVIDFNSGCGYAACSGDFQIVTGSVVNQYAQPAGTDTPYLSVPNPRANGSASFDLGTSSDYFGLFWGSIDSYNSISFFRNDFLIASYTGTDLVGQFANGNQVSFSSNRYINFDFGSDVFNTVVLTSNGFAFESDNHAYRVVASVPEPATALLMLVGLLGLFGARQRLR